MKLHNPLAIDDEFYLNGVKFFVHDIKPPSIFYYREDGDKKIREISYISLIEDPTFKIADGAMQRSAKIQSNEEKKVSFMLDTLSPERKKKTFERLNLVKPLLLFDKIKQGDLYALNSFNEHYKSLLLKDNETIADITKKGLLERISGKSQELGGKKRGTRQLERYLKDYYDSENNRGNFGVEGLISKRYYNTHSREDEKAIQIRHPKKDEIILDTIYCRIDNEAYISVIEHGIKRFLAKKRRKISHLHSDLEILCSAKSLEPLLYDTVYKMVQRINSQIYDRLSKGNMEAEYHDPVTQRVSGYFAKSPLHVIEIDHAQLPIKLIDETTGSDLGEPWLTLAIDVYTRMIWGFDLSFQSPSGHKVMCAVYNGLCLKRAKQNYGTINDWEMHGIPTVFYMDNGTEFNNAYVKSMIEDELHAEVRFRPIATPRYGGIIERYFRTINDEFLEELLGYYNKGSKAEDRQAARKEAILTLSDLTELLVRYFVDVYHFDTHKGLPLDQDTPAVRFYEAVNIMGYPPSIPTDQEESYLIKLLPVDMKSYDKDGIREDNVRYASPETSRFINTRLKKNVKIKYDVRDISKIYILDTTNQTYIEVPSISPPAEQVQGMSRALYRAIRKVLIDKGKINKRQIPGSDQIVEGKKMIKERFETMVNKNASMRKHILNKVSNLSVTLPAPEPTVRSSTSQTQSLIERYNNQRNGTEI
ncbi:Mu transposase C-terminal domain-containing protein [Paenibacillus oryzisoli]|uniref:transposase n=1 Tax=Paenibacillus oryzisoli TaxID=1850517 RepID=UPI003D278014